MQGSYVILCYHYNATNNSFYNTCTVPDSIHDIAVHHVHYAVSRSYTCKFKIWDKIDTMLNSGFGQKGKQIYVKSHQKDMILMFVVNRLLYLLTRLFHWYNTWYIIIPLTSQLFSDLRSVKWASMVRPKTCLSHQLWMKK